MRFCRILVGLLAALLTVGAAAASVDAKVSRMATLTASQPETTFTDVAEAHGVLVAGGQGLPEVFTPSGAGWVSGRAAAVLVGADRRFLLATTGELIVASSADGLATDPPMVFVQPAGGWSGNVSASARLVASTGVGLTEAAAAGSIVVASGEDGALYVFRRPAAGWSGTVSETARLVDSAGAQILFPPALAGGRILAALGPIGGRRIDVFTEPAAGWAGVITQSGVIADQRTPFLVSGADVLGTIDPLSFGVDYESPIPAVFSQSSEGLDGPVSLAARLYEATAKRDIGTYAFSGGVAAVSTVDVRGPATPGPWPTEVTVFTKPAHGWSGTLTARSAIARSLQTFPQRNVLALDGHVLFVASLHKVTVYRVSGTEGVAVKPPTTSRAIAKDLTKRRPMLRFRVKVGAIDPRLTEFELRLPRGLSLVTSRRLLQRALGTQRAPGTPLFAATVTNDHGRLAVHPLLPLPPVFTITITSRGLRESRALVQKAKHRLRRRRELVLRGRLRTIDSVGTVRARQVLFRVGP